MATLHSLWFSRPKRCTNPDIADRIIFFRPRAHLLEHFECHRFVSVVFEVQYLLSARVVPHPAFKGGYRPVFRAGQRFCESLKIDRVAYQPVHSSRR